eukprot:GFYU01027851.1.p2 GENE.GFYU01027851.1~~GFYU01027851.1.p2  ORF type:complete len:218 (-),score=69.53 GFYU01027851.1:214-867(-)
MSTKTSTSIRTVTKPDGTVEETTTVTVTKPDGSTSTTTTTKITTGGGGGGGSGGKVASPMKGPAPQIVQPKEEFDKLCLQRHNELRALHGAAPMEYDAELARTAQVWADKLAKAKKMEHGGHEGMGQNLAWCSGMEVDGAYAANEWYSEIEDYDFEKGKSKNGKAVGHFTQVVWDNSVRFGVGRAKVGKETYIVGHYAPPGNWVGEYTKHVAPLSKQ